jgi:hypothetical protein
MVFPLSFIFFSESDDFVLQVVDPKDIGGVDNDVAFRCEPQGIFQDLFVRL